MCGSCRDLQVLVVRGVKDSIQGAQWSLQAFASRFLQSGFKVTVSGIRAHA